MTAAASVVVTPTFDEPSHTYLVDGERVLSVTQALRLAGHVDSSWFTEFARQRGSAVHRALELQAHGTLPPDYHPDLQPYLDAHEAAKQALGFRIRRTELRAGHRVKRIAGTADAIVEFDDGSEGCLDYKTGLAMPYHRLQVAGYVDLLYDDGMVFLEAKTRYRVRRGGLYLRADGSWNYESYSDRNDFAVWDATRLVALWRYAEDRRRCERELLDEGSLDHD